MKGSVQSAIADDGMTPEPNWLCLKLDCGEINPFITTVPLLRAWVKAVDAGLKPTGIVAVIFDNETFDADVSPDDASAFQFAVLPVKRKPDG
ncbi:hypothetical protein LGM63_14915 [Burkholderia cepacia]|uniref:hypothetical protein n=1 Tax=Burkholderia cepacia TaxID=292 RepID=UPI001CF23008|nr:hypothetical protein [Burkholderia cepacia]MCA7991935.1 hypothetical protein [Burkholderia cepacia]